MLGTLVSRRLSWGLLHVTLARNEAFCLPQVTLYSMYVSIMAFNAKVSDPLIGGTYMTLLNTVSNLGGNWPATVALWLVDPLTVKECAGASTQNCQTSEAAEVSGGLQEGRQAGPALDCLGMRPGKTLSWPAIMLV